MIFDRLRQLLAPPPALPTKSYPLFRDFAARWFQTYPAAAGNRETTRREKEIHLRVHLVPALGDVRLDEIKREHLDRLFAGLRTREDRIGEKSIKNISATLRRIFASAVEWEVLKEAPALPKIKVPATGFDFYTIPETEQLLNAAIGSDRALLTFALHTGARAGELRAMDWQGIDFRSRLVIIRRSLAANTRTIGPTKSGKTREVPLSARLGALLEPLAGARDALVFARPNGQPVTLTHLHDRLRAVSSKAGLRKTRWHELRHTYASHLVMRGIPLRVIQGLLGHSSMAMTERYAHLAPGGGDAVINVLDGEGSP